MRNQRNESRFSRFQGILGGFYVAWRSLLYSAVAFLEGGVVQ